MMFGSIFGSSKKEEEKKEEKKEKKKSLKEELAETMRKWTLTDISTYISGGREDMPPTPEGMAAIVHRFANFRTEDKNYPKGKREMEREDLAQRSKKVMDIVISICKGPYVDGKVLVEITKFIEIYSGFFKYYDTKNKDMYAQKILKAYQIAVMKFEEKSKLEIKARF